jgi:hypothetical protein
LVTKISHHRSGALSALFRFKNGAEREASIIYPKPHSLRDGGLAARKERLDLGDLTQSGVLKLSRLGVAPAKGLRSVSIRLTPPDAVVWN